MKKTLLIAALAFATGFVSAQTTDTIVSKTPSNKNVVLEEFTGVNCQFCPDGHKIVNQIAADNPGRVFPINVHTGVYAAQYQTDFGSALASQSGLEGYPAGTVNRHVFSGSSTALSRGSFSSAANQIMNQSSPVNIAAEGTLDFSTRELNLTVQLYYTANSAVSTNMLNVAILQDYVLGPQIGASTWNPTQMLGNQYIHNHMLRHLITGQWGETITTTSAGTFVEKTYTYTIPEQLGKSGQQIDAVLEDLSFVVFVAEGHQEILTGTKATITGINMPAIASRIVSLQEVEVPGCDSQVKTVLNVKNLGGNTINSIQIKYKVGSGAYQTYTWQGSIATFAQEAIELPLMDVTPNTNQTIYVSIEGINGEAYTSDERTLTVNKQVYTCGGWMMLEIKTDNYGSETTLKLFDPNGTVVLSKGPFTNVSKVYQFDVEPQQVGCYRLEVYDSYGDGINNGYGSGYIKLYDANHDIIINHNGKFADKVSFNLDVTTPTGVENYTAANGDVRIFPNPANSILNFQAEEAISHVEIFNMQGQMVCSETGDVRSMSISDLSNGMYMVKVTTPAGTTTQKIVKQ